jgi:hypothetical protein
MDFYSTIRGVLASKQHAEGERFMSRKIYLSDTSSELQDLRPLVVAQIQAAGMTPLRLEESERRAPDMLNILRRKIQAADAFIGIVTFKRGWEPVGMSQRSLTEIEYDAAREQGIPTAMLLPTPQSALALSLRKHTFGQEIQDTDEQAAFWKRVENDGTAIYFGDETDLLRRLTAILNAWAAAPERAESFATEMPPAPPSPAPAVPAPGAPPPPMPQAAEREETARGTTSRATAPVVGEGLEIDRLAERIAEKTAARLNELQQRQQQDLAEQAIKINEALRLQPGELVFGRPAKGRQFQNDVFVIMPFAEPFAPVYTDVIKPLAAELKLTVLRGDELSSSRGSVMEEVWSALNACRFVIAEITGGNDNVFYELGVAHTLNKPAILITQSATPEGVPFDIRHLRYLRYENSKTGNALLRTDLQVVVTRLLQELDETGEM